MNKKIIIPEKHYVGMITRNLEDLPLAFITPDGSDESALKRKKTVDDWVAKHGAIWDPKTQTRIKTQTIPTKTIDNVPMVGFRLTKAIKRGIYGSLDKWRIEDPRGFELEISSMNLATLMGDTTIEKGEILEECVWARSHGNNVLVSKNSESYKQATNFTSLNAKNIDIKNLFPGNQVLLKNNKTVEFLGKFYEFGLLKYSENNKLFKAKSKKFWFLDNDMCVSINPKNIAKIVDNSMHLDQSAAELAANQKIKERILLDSINKSKIKIDFEPFNDKKQTEFFYWNDRLCCYYDWYYKHLLYEVDQNELKNNNLVVSLSRFHIKDVKDYATLQKYKLKITVQSDLGHTYTLT